MSKWEACWRGALLVGLPSGCVAWLFMAWVNRADTGFVNELWFGALGLPIWLIGGAIQGLLMRAADCKF